VDYALLLFSRYRSELLAGADPAQATTTALDTAGRSVLFAGSTVIVALLGLFLTGVGSLEGVALSVALTVLVTMLAAITLLPALLGIFGRRIERRLRRRAARTGRVPGARWDRWARAVGRHPWGALLAGTAVLLVLCVPALDMRLGFADAGAESPSLSSRRAYDAVADGFGPGYNGPLVVVSRDDSDTGEDLARTLETTDGVDAVTPAQPLGDSGYAALLAFPATAPQAEETTDLVHRLRDNVLPRLEERTGSDYLVGGSTAAAIDFSQAVADRLALFVLLVVGLSAVLLMAVFRSLLIPLKAAVLNLLSIGAALGVMTFVFQDGNLGAQPGPIEAFVPVLIFAVVFGLSMDYEVFLVSRMHEEWKAVGDPALAVRRGLVTTGGVITAAGAIMVVVFGSFLFSPDRMLQQFGLGLAVAVLLDAVVIRSLIVPGVMFLMGRRAWWLPRRLDAALPDLPLEAQPPA
jgi:putative drug exporter of the RND superfamily